MEVYYYKLRHIDSEFSYLSVNISIAVPYKYDLLLLIREELKNPFLTGLKFKITHVNPLII